jgi:hypothetical protein
MPALYPRWSNTVYRLVLAAIVIGVVGFPVALMGYVRSPWNTEQNQPIDQPVEFDHRHHVADDHIDCVYCHSGAEKSRNAGVPATEVCMGCHAQIWNESPLLEKVRRSYFSGKPVPWNRVHDVADFAYFDHSVHVQRGVGCVTCHGRVDQMGRMEKKAALNMQWCLQCHRAVEQARLGDSKDALTDGLSPDWFEPEPSSPDNVSHYDPLRGSLFHTRIAQEFGRGGTVTSLTTCSACHR